MRLLSPLTILDTYALRQLGWTLLSVFAIVISLMMVEHVPHVLDSVSLCGHKTYLVIQSMVALLPEYAGIGLLFGLYLSIAFATRRLSLRGELDIVQATGMSTIRWMRIPVIFAIVVAGLMLWDQGWLMPAGELRLSELTREAQDGQFGFDLEPGKFTELRRGIILKFNDVDPYTNELRGVFFRTANRTFTANRGRLGVGLADHVLVDLEDGRALNENTGESLSFRDIHFESGGDGTGKARQVAAAARRNRTSLPLLLSSDEVGDRAAAFSRLLWPIFVLLVPVLAATVGKPIRRSSTSLGLMLGLILLVMFIRSTELVTASRSAYPGLVALGTASVWIAIVCLVGLGERRCGAGYVDLWLLKVIGFGKLIVRAPRGRNSANLA